MNIKEIVKDNTARFSFYRAGNIYYEVTVYGNRYSFPVPIEDLGQATVSRDMKAITLMRYIRKAIDAETFVLVAKVEPLRGQLKDGIVYDEQGIEVGRQG